MTKATNNTLKIYYKDSFPRIIGITFIILLGYIGYIYGVINLPGITYTVYSYLNVFMAFYLLIHFSLKFVGQKKIEFRILYLMVAFVLYPTIISFARGRLTLGSLSDICIWPLLLLLSYCEERERKLHTDRHQFLIVSIVAIFSLLCIPLIIRNLAGQSLEGLVIRPTYFCLSLLPLVLCYLKGNKQIVTILMISATIFSSLKRTGIAALVVSLMCFYILSLYVTSDSKSKIRRILSILISGTSLLIITFIFAAKLDVNVFSRFANIQEDGGSGRFAIWGYILMLFRNGTWSERLFGHGYHAVGSLLLPGVMDGRSILAHNDFVEYIYDYGIIGTVCYILFVLMIIKKICEQFRSRNSFLPSDCTAFVIFISISLFSYGVVQSTTINMLAIYIGIMLARDARGEFSKELRIK